MTSLGFKQKFDIDISSVIANFIVDKPLKIRNWIDINKLNWEKLSSVPGSINLIEKNIDKINWDLLSSNPNIFGLDETRYKILKNSYTKLIYNM